MAALTDRHLPNFFIAGSPNAGTTSLYFYLRQHPQVYMSPDKEPTYFGMSEADPMRDAGLPEGWAARRRPLIERLLLRPPRPLTWDEYLQLFRGVRQEIAIGEASVHYLLLPAAAGAIRTRVPAARLIFVLRNPAETQYTRYLRMVWRNPGLSFRDWFVAATERKARWAQALTAGNYGTHLQRFFDLFPREQIQVHLYEDYAADERAVVRAIFEFLGVDPGVPIDVSRRHNRSIVPRFTALERLRRGVFGQTPLRVLVPSGARRALLQAYYRPLPAQRSIEAADRALVGDYYRREILRAGELIDRDLTAWLH